MTRANEASKQSLTGVWHGLYSYRAFKEPVYFVATIIDSGGFLSGSTHESEIGETGAPLALFASIEGEKAGDVVRFIKRYDGSGGWEHGVDYTGTVAPDGNEIEGQWMIGVEASGRFLMMRNRGVSEQVIRKQFIQA
jgi:hypothetical protein